MRSLIISPVVLLAALLPTAQAQTQLDSVAGFSASGRFGESLAFVGDLNGDDRDEWAAGAPEEDSTGGVEAGRVRVFDGASGAVLYTIDGLASGANLGVTLAAAGLVDADMIPDIVIGSPGGPGRVLVISGADGSTIHDIVGAGDALGYRVAGTGDVDGDGRDDFAATTLAGASDGVHVYSGSTGLLLFEVPVFSFIHSMDSAGDFNGDGFSDVVVGMADSSGEVRVYLGPAGALGYQQTGPGSFSQWGWSVAGAGDVDGDGMDDILIGSTGEGGFGNEIARVDLLPGGGGGFLQSWVASQLNTRLGEGVTPAGDVDADGVIDVAMTEPGAPDLNQVRVFSGATGLSIGTFADAPGFSTALVGGGDVDGDGFPDFLVPYPFDSSGRGKVDIWTFGCPVDAVYNYCVAAPNSAGPGAIIGHQNTPDLSVNNLRLTASGCPPQTFGLFYFGDRPIQAPFGEGFRCVGGHTFRLGVVPTGAGGTPSFQFNTGNPATPAGQISAGTTWFFQFWHRDNVSGMQTFNLSDGLRVTFCE